MHIPDKAQRILAAIASGDTLKSHRDIEGLKSFRLISAEGMVEVVEQDLIKDLRQRGLVDSNKKFPVATFWLTDLGRSMVNKSKP